MSIPAWTIVTVHPALMSRGSEDLVFNSLLLNAKPTVPLRDHIMSFGSADEVGSYFGLESREYKAALSYFWGYDEADIHPRTLFIARYTIGHAEGFIRSGPAPSAAQSLGNTGRLGVKLFINGVPRDVLLPASLSNSLSGLCMVLEEAVNAAYADEPELADMQFCIRYLSHGKRFLLSVTNPALSISELRCEAPEDSDVTDLANLFSLSEAAGATFTPSRFTASLADLMDDIRAYSNNWVSFTTDWRASKEEMLAFALWSTNEGVAYEYVPWTDDESALDPASQDDAATVLAIQQVESTARPVFGGLHYAMFLMGTIASIDWDASDGLTSLAFKSQNTLPPNVISEQVYDVLRQKGYNIYGSWAERNESFTWLYDGGQYGRWKYIDGYLAAIWLSNALQVAVMNGLHQRPRLSYTDAGYSFIHSWCDGVMRRGLVNGAVDTGVRLSNAQAREVLNESGMDMAHELYANGYYIQISDPGPAGRSRRESPVISIWYTFAGSVNRIGISATAVV